MYINVTLTGSIASSYLTISRHMNLKLPQKFIFLNLGYSSFILKPNLLLFTSQIYVCGLSQMTFTSHMLEYQTCSINSNSILANYIYYFFLYYSLTCLCTSLSLTFFHPQSHFLHQLRYHLELIIAYFTNICSQTFLLSYDILILHLSFFSLVSLVFHNLSFYSLFKDIGQYTLECPKTNISCLISCQYLHWATKKSQSLLFFCC